MPKAWQRKLDRRVMWIGAITFLNQARSHTFELDGEYSTDLKTRGTTQASAPGEIIDTYVYSTNDCVDPMRFGPAASPISHFSTVSSSDTAARNQRAAGGHAS